MHPTSQLESLVTTAGGFIISFFFLAVYWPRLIADEWFCDHPGYSYYASATSLTPRLYQSLIDRSWRRSGTLLYRPNQKAACCPHYTLRLDAERFKPAKDQRQAVNRFNKYVTGEKYAKEAARLHPIPRQEARKRDNEFDLVQRVHEAETHQLKAELEPAHRFEVTLEPDTFTEEKYTVFENYQRIVHKEPPSKISRGGFKRFLCQSPLGREQLVDADGKERQLGSFHQCYRLDGVLVAIGVLDLLPHCVSAVYFAYHESIHMHNPGKLGAMREIALAVEGGYGWWYPGFYIHSCPKMRYKIDYSPQYVLDPEMLAWDPLDKEAMAIFDSKSYVSMSRERRGPGDDEMAVENATAKPDSDMEICGEDPGEDLAGGSAEASDENAMKDEEEASDEEEDDEESASLFTSDMPGIPSLEEMLQVDMDGLRLSSDYAIDLCFVSDLAIWHTQDVRNLGSLKSRIAELVAAIGPDLMHEICLDFRRRSAASD